MPSPVSHFTPNAWLGIIAVLARDIRGTGMQAIGTRYAHRLLPAAHPGFIPFAWMTAAPAGEIRYVMNALAASGSLQFAARADT